MEQENLISVVNEGKKIAVVKQQEIDLGFFSERQGAIIDMMAEGCNPKHRLTEEGEVYYFDSPTFVTKIQTEGPSDGITIHYATASVSNDVFVNEDNIDEDDDSSVSTCYINKSITAFRVKSNHSERFFKSQKVTRVLVNIITPTDLLKLSEDYRGYQILKQKFESGYESQLKALDAAKSQYAANVKIHEAAVAEHKQRIVNEKATHDQELINLKTELQAYVQKTKEATSNFEVVESDLVTQREALQHVVEQVASKEVELRTLENSASEITLRIDERNSEYKLKTTEVTAITDKLKKLTADSSLFADDIPNFTRQGDSQIKNYFILLACIVVIASGLVAVSIHSAYQAYSDYVNNPSLGVWNLLAFKALLVALVYFAGKFLFQFAKPFIVSILTINDKKLSLSQITILAREFTDAATDGTELDEDERLHLRMNTRMKLIKEYLGGAYQHNQPQYFTESKRPLIDVTTSLPQLKVTDKETKGTKSE